MLWAKKGCFMLLYWSYKIPKYIDGINIKVVTIKLLSATKWQAVKIIDVIILLKVIYEKNVYFIYFCIFF